MGSEAGRTSGDRDEDDFLNGLVVVVEVVVADSSMEVVALRVSFESLSFGGGCCGSTNGALVGTTEELVVVVVLLVVVVVLACAALVEWEDGDCSSADVDMLNVIATGVSSLVFVMSSSTPVSVVTWDVLGFFVSSTCTSRSGLVSGLSLSIWDCCAACGGGTFVLVVGCLLRANSLSKESNLRRRRPDDGCCCCCCCKS